MARIDRVAVIGPGLRHDHWRSIFPRVTIPFAEPIRSRLFYHQQSVEALTIGPAGEFLRRHEGHGSYGFHLRIEPAEGPQTTAGRSNW